MSEGHKITVENTCNEQQKTVDNSDTTANAANMAGLGECHGQEGCITFPLVWRMKRDHSHRCVAQHCVRFGGRRDALNDPERMAMKQETRERLEAEVEQRRQTVKYKVNKALGKVYDGLNEVDLI